MTLKHIVTSQLKMHGHRYRLCGNQQWKIYEEQSNNETIDLKWQNTSIDEWKMAIVEQLQGHILEQNQSNIFVYFRGNQFFLE